MPKIGLQIHLHLNLKNKLFCNCEIDNNSKPNTNVCQICLGLPGSMPIINKQAITHALTLANYLNMEISDEIQFDRKHYIYPDLPKGYQITQYFKPIAKKGFIKLKEKYKNLDKIIRFK